MIRSHGKIVNTNPIDRLLDEQISTLLKAAPAYRTLARPRREALRDSITKISRTLLWSEAEVLSDKMDFPKFVEDLIKGTFEALVDASNQQMEAYADLVQGTAESIDRYAAENIPDDEAREYLRITRCELLTLLNQKRRRE